MRSWVLILAITVIVAGTSFGIHRWQVAEATEEGRPTAERRNAERTQQQQAAARVDTLKSLLTVLEQKLADRPLDSMLVISAANVAYDLGRFDQAERYYRTFLEKIDPSNAAAKIDMAYVVFQSGRHDDAIAILQSVIETNPKNQTAMFNLAYMLDQKGDAKGSMDMMAKVRDADPTSQLGQQAASLLSSRKDMP